MKLRKYGFVVAYNIVMDHSIIIYKIKPDDTLSTIGQKIGMSADEVRDFHNLHCERNGLMYFNSLIGIEKILLPKNFKSAAHIQKENTEAVPPKKLSPVFFAKSYQVVESYESDFENTVEISYKADIKLEDLKENQTKILVATVAVSDFLKNGEEPDDKMSELSIACADSIAPLQFTIPENGQIAKVYGFENLQNRFQEERKDLEDFFIGEVAEKFLNQFAHNISDKDYFHKQINSSLLYQILFPNMNWFHKQNDWKENFYLVKNSFPLNCIFNINFNHLNDEEIQTILKGEVMEEVSLQQLLQGKQLEEEVEENMTGLVEIKYITQKTSKQLLKVEAGIALIYDREIYRKHKITVSKI